MFDTITTDVYVGPAGLPDARGALTDLLLPALEKEPHALDSSLGALVEDASEDDLQLALYCCYELHYGGFAGVSSRWEWEPSLLGFRRVMEERLESELRALAGPVASDPADVKARLRSLAASGGGPSLSSWLEAHGTIEHVRELAKHRSAYQLKEADPHTWAIPRLAGEAKAVLVAIQAGEYGDGSNERMHSTLFGRTMETLGLSSVPNVYLGELPGSTLLTTNLISMFGLHRRLRGALVGHLALFEMTSSAPMSRYADILERLGVPAAGRQFYEVHIEADLEHEQMATEGMVAGLLKREPGLAGDVMFGARALQVAEVGFAAALVADWEAGRSSLRYSG